MTVSERLADFTYNTKLEDIPAEVQKYGKLLLMDTFGVAMTNQNLEHAQAIKRVVLDAHSNPEAELWGMGQKVQLIDAVLYNAALIHGSDYDDTHVSGIVHPSAAVVSTAVSVGEYVNASGKEIYEAIIVGWEVIIRLALAAKGRFHDVGYHGTGILAPFASACVAAKLMKLPKEVLINALGICGSQSAAIQEFLHDGTWTKKMHPGWGAHSAIYALRLAKAGFTGPRKVFEGGFGMWMTHIGGTDGFEALDDLGKKWRTTEITFKMYPVCHMTHSFIDCLLELKDKEHITPDMVEKIECRIEDRCYHIVCEPREAKTRPDSDYIMRFSLPYVMAISMIKGKVSPWEIDIRYAKSTEVQNLMDRVECISDDTKRNPGYFPGWLKLTTKDGREYVMDQRYEKGTVQNPVDLNAVKTKFINNLSEFYTEEEIEHMLDVIQNIDGSKSIEPLLKSVNVSQKKII